MIYWSSFTFFDPNFCLHKNCFDNKIKVFITESPLELISPKIASFLPSLKLGKYVDIKFPTISQNSLTTGQFQAKSCRRSK